MDEQGASRSRRALAVVAVIVLADDFGRNLLGWWGFGAVAVLVLAASIAVLAREGVPWRRIPPSLYAFLGLAVLSIAWSFSPGATALGVAILLATTVAGLMLAGLDWHELVDCLGVALRWILALSLLFELFVAVVIRGPLLPLWVDYSRLEEIPRAFYWSRGLLFEGGRIQGVVGNANLLGMLALVALLVSLACWAARRGSRPWNLIWAAVAAATLLLTRSTTVLVALVAVALVVGVAALTARLAGRARIALQAGAGAAAVVLAAVAVALREPLLALLGKSADLTNRLEIWESVAQLAASRPVAGWGWLGFWPPWLEPFDELAVYGGVTYLQAHNAWLDVALQLGAVGLVVFGVLVLGTAVRSWLAATEPGRPLLDGLLPLALLAALLAQSLAESRLLVEWNWALLVALVVRGAQPTAPPRIPESRSLPVPRSVSPAKTATRRDEEEGEDEAAGT